MCYLLNQKVSDGTQVWYQNLSGQNADAYPVLKKMTIVRYIMDTKNVQEYIRIKAVYTGADAANYEMTIVEVEVQRSQCRHNLDKVTAAAATEVQEGNKEYYICKDCGKLFEDAQGMFEITKESTVIPKLEKNSQVSETPKPRDTKINEDTGRYSGFRADIAGIDSAYRVPKEKTDHKLEKGKRCGWIFCLCIEMQ